MHPENPAGDLFQWRGQRLHADAAASLHGDKGLVFADASKLGLEIVPELDENKLKKKKESLRWRRLSGEIELNWNGRPLVDFGPPLRDAEEGFLRPGFRPSGCCWLLISHKSQDGLWQNTDKTLIYLEVIFFSLLAVPNAFVLIL